jgi:hypothetical protein
MDHMPNHSFYKATYHDRAAFERVKSKPFVQDAYDKDMKVLYTWKAGVPKDLPVFDEVLDGIKKALQ